MLRKSKSKEIKISCINYNNKKCRLILDYTTHLFMAIVLYRGFPFLEIKKFFSDFNQA